jgi:outer membrane immunogenic protein
MKNLLLVGIGTCICIGPWSGSSAMAADVSKRLAPVYKAAPKVIEYTWGGCYVGVQGGYSWGRSRTDVNSSSNRIVDENPGDYSSSPRGAIAGGQLGCNYQFSGHWMIGIEGEGWRSWLKQTTIQSSDDDPTELHTLRSQNMWDAALSLRLGYAVDHVLFYAKGGGAYGSFQYTFIDGADFHDFDVNSIKFGSIVGGGIEYAFTQNWTAKIEYDYLNFGNNRINTIITGNAAGDTAGITPYRFSVKETKTIIKAGLNFKF